MIDLILDDRPVSRYAEEILGHAGLAWRTRTLPELTREPVRPGIVLLSGRGRTSREERDWFASFVERGGAIVISGGTFGLEELAGARETGGRAEGYLGIDGDHVVTAGLLSSLHVFESVALNATAGDALAGLLDSKRVARIGDTVVARRIGRGAIVTIGADIAASVHLIQHGHDIHRDGVPAPDGTAALDDGVLKVDDGLALSWEHDRIQTLPGDDLTDCLGVDPAYPNGDTPWFGIPIADELRRLLLQALAWTAAETGQALAFTAPWPRRLPAVGTISHDSDLNIDQTAQTTLRLLQEAGIRSTWCQMEGPTYPDRFSGETWDRIAADGHEIALHYNALDRDGGVWGKDHLFAQADWLRGMSGGAEILSNKNHYTRWEGNRFDFFHWLEDAGIGSDQTRGPSKKGNVGFPVGSCLPWYPFDIGERRRINVIEVPLHTQDLWLTTPYAIAPVIIDQAVRQGGAAHFLFHQVHLDRRPMVAESFHRVIAEGRARGLEWWTSAEIAAWERLRRRIAVSVQPLTQDRLRVVLDSPVPVAGFGLVVISGGLVGNMEAVGAVAMNETVAFGQRAVELTLDLPRGETAIELSAG
jgi:hypothetical protein